MAEDASMQPPTARVEPSAEDTWYLRAGTDSVYGQLSLKTLTEWAEQGRLIPESEVSRNSVDWVPAESLAELKMDWRVTLKSGASYGPLNLLAIPALYRRGVIDATATLENKLTKRQIPAVGLLRGVGRRDAPAGERAVAGGKTPTVTAAAEDGERRRAVPESATPPPDRAQDAAQPVELTDSDVDIEGLKRLVSEGRLLVRAQAEIESLKEALAHEQQRHADTAANAADTAKIRERVITEAEQGLAELRRQHDALIKESRASITRMRKETNEVETLLRLREQEKAELAQRLQALADGGADRSARLAELTASLAALTTERDALRQDRAAAEAQRDEAELRVESLAIEHEHEIEHLREEAGGSTAAQQRRADEQARRLLDAEAQLADSQAEVRRLAETKTARERELLEGLATLQQEIGERVAAGLAAKEDTIEDLRRRASESAQQLEVAKGRAAQLVRVTAERDRLAEGATARQAEIAALKRTLDGQQRAHADALEARETQYREETEALKRTIETAGAAAQQAREQIERLTDRMRGLEAAGTEAETRAAALTQSAEATAAERDGLRQRVDEQQAALEQARREQEARDQAWQDERDTLQAGLQQSEAARQAREAAWESERTKLREGLAQADVSRQDREAAWQTERGKLLEARDEAGTEAEGRVRAAEQEAAGKVAALEGLIGELREQAERLRADVASKDELIARIKLELGAQAELHEQSRQALQRQVEALKTELEGERARQSKRGAKEQAVLETERHKLAAGHEMAMQRLRDDHAAELQVLEDRLVQREQELTARIEALQGENTKLTKRVDELLAQQKTALGEKDRRIAALNVTVEQLTREAAAAAEAAAKSAVVADAEQWAPVLQALEALRDALDRDGPEMPEQPGTTWFLKSDDGEVYGPVGLADLRAWAMDCRLGPEHRVSTDRKEWTSASDIDALEMDWMVTLVDGELFGPVHLLAVESLRADGAVAADAAVCHASTGEKGPYTEMLAADLQRRLLAPAVESRHGAPPSLAERVREPLERLGQACAQAAAAGALPAAALRDIADRLRR